MKKAALSFIIIATVGFIIVSQVFSQEEEEFNFDRAYQDYVFILNGYRQEHEEYLLARSQYIQAGTLAAEVKAREETIQMLRARDQVVITYLTALRMRLAEAKGVSELERGGLNTRLDNDVAWYKEHKERVLSASTLNDLTIDSNQARSHFDVITEKLAYEVLSVIAIGKSDIIRSKTSTLLVSLKDKTAAIREEGDHETKDAERWITEAENKLTRSLDRHIEVQKILSDLQTGKGKENTNYSTIISGLQSSFQLLREVASLMRNIIQAIKTVS